MKKLLLFFFISYILHLTSFSQSYDPLHKPNTYRNADNPYYWKNRKPYEGYWQQDTYYQIQASIDEKTDIIDGKEQLTYWNNSPDELNFVFFHLYQNAFQPDSYYDKLQKNNAGYPTYGHYESQKLGTVIEKMSGNNKVLKMELDNTILKVYLDAPLKSGESIVFDINFKTYVDSGSVRRRMKKFDVSGFKHFDGVHWYPRICVYDRIFGWTTDQHLGTEFYGDFGAYDVELTFANNYVVEATGNLLNKEEMLPDSLRKKLDIKNFVNKPFGSAPSTIIPVDGTRKTWKYHAENVHDFAWTADPTYRIGEAEWNGIKCIAMAQEQHAAGWQNAAEFTAKVIKTYSEDIGMYAYPKMIVADARDGMEYPMLTLDGGWDPNYRYLFAHEVGHNWFYGMIGNNETYRAALDEGFTQFLTIWCMNKLDGEYEIKAQTQKNFFEKYVENHSNEHINRDKWAYLAYLSEAIAGNDPPLNTHSDYFGNVGNNNSYRQVYMKTATMLYNLQYVLGDELFLKAMQHYFDKWKICHPYLEDFRAAIIEYTHADLNWFFDEWLNTTKSIDYEISFVRKGKNKDEHIISFTRKGKMQMPIEFTVFADDGKQYNYYIPNTWFEKKFPQGGTTVLPKWTGWDKLNPTYNATVTIPSGIDNVVIDTTHRLADINMMNNSYKLPAVLSFDAQIANRPDWTKYEMKARPDVWYNSFDGFKFGFHLNGNYMNYRDIFDLTVWANTGLAQKKYDTLVRINRYDNIAYRFSYRTPLNKISKNTFINISAKSLDGLQAYSLGIDKYDLAKKNRFYFTVKSMYRMDSTALMYLLYPKEWTPSKFNNTISVGVERNVPYRYGLNTIMLNLKSSTIGSDYDYSLLTYSFVNKSAWGKIDFRSRMYVQFETGTNLANESALYLAGANPEELMENKFTRSRGFIDNTWLGYDVTTNHFQQGGGLNLRGYAGYLVAEEKNGEVRTVYKGSSGASVSAEVGFDRLLNIKLPTLSQYFRIETYLFGDAGTINYNISAEKLAFANIRADAGVGATFTIKKWGPLQTTAPLTIRFDMPFFLNSIPATDISATAEPQYIKMRWVMGINRSF